MRYQQLTSKKKPVKVISSGVSRVACGSFHSCALFGTGARTGAVQCFGNGEYGRLAIGGTSDSNTPVDVTGYESSGAAHVGAGVYHSCLIKAVDGAVLCAGLNLYGQVGDGSSTDRSTMTQVSGLSSGYLSVDGGGHHSCAVSSIGGLVW
jgi:alpha-tubulin suppressor-like RCC1 family protein